MRLIDADALIESIKNTADLGGWIGEALYQIKQVAIKYIDSAPTIEPTEEFEWCTDCKEYDQEKHCCHRWTKVIRKTVAEIEEEYKPKRGEWGRVSADKYVQHAYHYYRCSECGYDHIGKTNFCPNCGADMSEVRDE